MPTMIELMPALPAPNTRPKWPHIALAAWLLVGAGAPAQAQDRNDPIGELTRTATFDRAERVTLGRSRSGVVACYFREDGSSHKTDIGISRDGAFVRVDRGDEPLAADAIPRPPLKVFAGKALTKIVGGDEKVTGEYAAIATYDGAVDYRPALKTSYGDGFALIAKGDARAFLATVARARGEFMVVQSAAASNRVDIIAIYRFNTRTMMALLSCAAKHLRP